ncbi:archaeosortase/exosortase family protein [Rhizobacter sp. J219]|uniref:archaeosortase/exosortase family protein n=1 Tax=Rhizobacter sp. J219 TaxID=2898430 RepID=UPI002151C958|nr:archaeosortase/exosortase family protein [Rhizobacter sp. J219]MCR5881908.1 archaeosortase/exosortase family protein [Rhizobacter sp. J219]
MSASEDAVSQRVPMRSLAFRAIAFVLLFMALQAGWEAARGSWLERLWVHHLTVQSATQVITVLTPEVPAVAKGPRISAPGGGINVLFGCEGTDVVFMLTAALLVFPMAWRQRLGGWLAGLAWVLVLNVLRIVALFYAYRSDPGLFDLLHTAAAPLVMVVLTGLFFHVWLARSTTAPPSAPSAA